MIDRSSVAGILVGIAIVTPRVLLSDTLVVCPFRRLTGLPCPMCGITRSWQAAAHLHPHDSVRYHPLGAATLAAAAAIALSRTDELPAPMERRSVQLSAAAIWIGAWLWRLRRE